MLQTYRPRLLLLSVCIFTHTLCGYFFEASLFNMRGFCVGVPLNSAILDGSQIFTLCCLFPSLFTVNPGCVFNSIWINHDGLDAVVCTDAETFSKTGNCHESWDCFYVFFCDFQQEENQQSSY